MVISRISWGISQPQIPPCQKKDTPKRDCSHFRTLQLFLWDPVGSECLLENCETVFNLAGSIYLEQHISFKLAQVPPCSGIRRSISCLFWNTTPAKVCCLFRAILINLIPRNLIFGVFIIMTLICISEWVSEIAQGLTGVLSVLFCFSPWLDSWVVNPGVMS